jgi:uncharacterized membrane protein/gas vesicle protein
MKKLSAMLTGASLGASAVYLFDPVLGKRRRALLRDQARGSTNDIKNFFDVAVRDLKHRIIGIAGDIRYQTRGQQVDDSKLRARVESKMGRFVSHPRAVDISVQSGLVVLRGHILEHEILPLLSALESIPGVREVQNELTTHTRAENFPALQGGIERTGNRPEIFQENWSPATRLICGAVGAITLMRGLKPSGLKDGVMLGTGMLLLSRSISNRPILQLLGARRGGRGIVLQKHLNVYAPVQEVFDFLREPANFPQVMLNVHEVRNLGEGRSHWSVRGPAGHDISWTARITRLEPNRLIAWETDQDSELIHSGSIRVEPVSDAATRILFQLTYHAPGGIVGQMAASALGANPRSEFESDLLRLKTFLETGKPAHDVATKQRLKQNSEFNANVAATR